VTHAGVPDNLIEVLDYVEAREADPAKDEQHPDKFSAHTNGMIPAIQEIVK